MSVPYSDRDGSEAPKSFEGNEPETPFVASGSPSNLGTISDILRRVTDERHWGVSDRALGESGEDFLVNERANVAAWQERDALRAEVERLSLAHELQFQGSQIYRLRAEKAEATVERVRALAGEQWLDPVNYLSPLNSHLTTLQRRLRAILDADAPGASEEGRS